MVWYMHCTTTQKLFNQLKFQLKIFMSVIVLAEHAQGSFKKKAFEAIQYASGIAQNLGTSVTAVVLGTASEDAMQQLGAYGAQKVLHVSDARLNNLNSRAYTKALIAAAEKEG